MGKQMDLFRTHLDDDDDEDLGITYDEEGRPYLEKAPPPEVVLNEYRYTKHKLLDSIARALIALAELYRGEPINQNRFAPKGTEYSNWNKAKHWGLAREEPNEDDPSIRCSGMHHLTPLGWKFIQGRKKVYSHIYTFRGKFIAFAGELITIHQALENNWDYQEWCDDNGIRPNQFAHLWR